MNEDETGLTVVAVMSVEREQIQDARDQCRKIADMGCWG
jgi:hypothetical protein